MRTKTAVCRMRRRRRTLSPEWFIAGLSASGEFLQQEEQETTEEF